MNGNLVGRLHFPQGDIAAELLKKGYAKLSTPKDSDFDADYYRELKQAQLIVNLRAEAAPEQLEAALKASMEAMQASQPQVTGQLSHLEHFRPGKPVPTHRLTSCP